MNPSIKAVVFSLATLVGVALADAPLYHPLSKSERKAFIATSQAFRAAYDERNFGTIERFGSAVLESYASIDLDPDCKDLRTAYREIRTIIESAKTLSVQDTLARAADYAYLGNDWKACVNAYQPYLEFLTLNHKDSLFQSNWPRFKECQETYSKQNQNLQTLAELQHLKYSDATLLAKLSKRLEAKVYQAFLSASANLNRDSLLEFRKQYPDLFVRDLQTLLEKSQQKQRLSLLRHPSKEGIISYYAIYPEHDLELDKLMEQVLFRAFMARPSVAAGNEYLLSFPDGMRAQIIRSNLQTLFADSAAGGRVSARDPSYLDAPAEIYPGDKRP